VLVAAHATVLPGVVIGPHAVVGAGAVVVADVPGHTTVAGVPARKRRAPAPKLAVRRGD
jgi:acetyltransferase-like isoleucine patch superfamily enzyme